MQPDPPAGQSYREVFDEALVEYLNDAGNGLADVADCLDAVLFKLDGYENADLRRLADTFRGAAYRAAMALPGQRATDALNRLDAARKAREEAP